MEDLVPVRVVATVTVVDSTGGSVASLNLQSGHEYEVQVRAHDIVAVGISMSQWTLPGWPEVGGFTISSDHTAQLARRVRIDTSPPNILDVFVFRYSEGHDERVPVLYGGDPRLSTLQLSAVLQPGEGFTFLADPDLLNMRLAYGAYDAESGLRLTRFEMREVSFKAAFSTYQRTLYVSIIAVPKLYNSVYLVFFSS